ncbi:hypothetical protein L7F22_021238 [Adiantum nelumboides]|nr:hypothetical protein [Adiantum nelumboides]
MVVDNAVVATPTHLNYNNATVTASTASTIKSTYPTRVLVASTFATMVLSVPLIVTGFWLALPKHHETCFRFIEFHIIAIGIGLFVASVVGMVGVQRRERLLLWVYVVTVFGLILYLCAMVIFTMFVTRGGPAYSVSKAAFKEYRLGGYSLWFQGQVGDAGKWGEMAWCLRREERVCDGLDRAYPSKASFYKARLTPPQSGCCKPPTLCGASFVRATEWVDMTHSLATSDCGRWDNRTEVLCYQCSSCRAGLLENVKHVWRLVAYFSLAILGCLVVIYSIAWLGFLKGLWDDTFPSNIKVSTLRGFIKCAQRVSLNA